MSSPPMIWHIGPRTSLAKQKRNMYFLLCFCCGGKKNVFVVGGKRTRLRVKDLVMFLLWGKKECFCCGGKKNAAPGERDEKNTVLKQGVVYESSLLKIHINHQGFIRYNINCN